MIYKFLDTETTGVPDFKLRSNDPVQPRICSIATIKTDHNGLIIDKKKVLIKPDGWKVSQYNIDTCKITQEMCEDMGVLIKDIYEEIEADAKAVDFFVAHSSTFDAKMMKIEATRLGHEEIFPNEWLCTMRQATPICKIPNKNGYKGFKWPTLQEAYMHFFGKPFDGAHDAGADIQATMEIFFAMNQPKTPMEQALDAVQKTGTA